MLGILISTTYLRILSYNSLILHRNLTFKNVEGQIIKIYLSFLRNSSVELLYSANSTLASPSWPLQQPSCILSADGFTEKKADNKAKAFN